MENICADYFRRLNNYLDADQYRLPILFFSFQSLMAELVLLKLTFQMLSCNQYVKGFI